MDLRSPASFSSSIALLATSAIRAAAYIFKPGHRLTRRSRCASCVGGFPQKQPRNFCIKSFGFEKMATAGLLELRRSGQRTYIAWRFQAPLDVAMIPSRFRLALKKSSPQAPELSESASHPSFRAHCGARSLRAALSSVREESLFPFSVPTLKRRVGSKRADFS